jgi:hypothetical protein
MHPSTKEELSNDGVVCQTPENLEKLFGGKPGEGIHAPRIGPYAVVDLAITAAAAYFITPTAWGGMGIFIVFVLLIIISLFVHQHFCVHTSLTQQMGLLPPLENVN